MQPRRTEKIDLTGTIVERGTHRMPCDTPETPILSGI